MVSDIQVTATVPPNTSVIDITFAAGTPEKARQGSHAFAEAYIQVRTDAAAADIAVQVEGLNNQITGSQKQIMPTSSTSSSCTPFFVTRAASRDRSSSNATISIAISTTWP